MKEYQKALLNYHKARNYIEGLQSADNEYYKYAREGQKVDEAQNKQISDLKQTLYLNMTQIYINQGKFEKGLEFVNKALSISEIVKGLYRRGLIHYELNNLDQAKLDLEKAQGLDPSLKTAVAGLLKDIRKKEMQADEQLASKLKNMFK